ncbi:MAG: hypothetical protein AAFX80_15870 [Cyanobacteria bacterium J06639_18]
MDKWQQDFWETVQTVADEVERFFEGVTEIADSFVEFTEETIEQVQYLIITEVEEYLQEITEPISDFDWNFEDILDDEFESSFPYPVEATTQNNPACIGCQHYHGQVYNGNLLVCAMHPHGRDDDNCPDWEKQELDF